jgi:hypothetical protein
MLELPILESEINRPAIHIPDELTKAENLLKEKRYLEVLRVSEKVTVHRFRVQRSGLRTKKALKIRSPHYKCSSFPGNCQFSFKFWIRPDETDAFIVNTHPKCSPGIRMEP